MQVPRGYVTRAPQHPANVFMTDRPPAADPRRPPEPADHCSATPNGPSRRPLPAKELYGVTQPNLGHPTNYHGQRASPRRRKEPSPRRNHQTNSQRTEALA